MTIQTLPLPVAAQERARAFQLEIQNLEGKLNQFIDGVLVGMGVDVKNNELSVDLRSMTVSIAPKGEGYPLPPKEENVT